MLGGGLVAGGVVLLGGDPGIGKSTLLLQACAALGAAHRTLYVTGEESVEQVALRAQRLGLVNAPVEMLAEVQLEAIVAAIGDQARDRRHRFDPDALHRDAEIGAGQRAQVRECAAQLTRLAKQRGIVVVFVGHVTKEGAIAGPRVLEHIVDTVLYFEGDPHSSFRLVRAIKNRFGAANELGVFGDDRARAERRVESVGVVPVAARGAGARDRRSSRRSRGRGRCWSRSRRWSIPVQGGMPRRLAVGLDPQRLALLLAVLHRHGGVDVGGYDVFVNAVGGVRINEPAADLAVLLAVNSSLKNRPLPSKSLVFGEVGLAGEIRPVQRGQDRIKEAAKLGFRTVVIPSLNKPRQAVEGIEIVPVARVSDALDFLRRD